MPDAKRFFAISATLSFGLGIVFLAYFNYLEYQARQDLPPEMRTPEAIQYYYDGSVCLGCDVAGAALFILFSAIGTLTAGLWGISATLSKKQPARK
jgi:hypothetical protein